MSYLLKNKHYDKKKALKLFGIPLLFLFIIVGLNFIQPNVFTPLSHAIDSPFFRLKNIVSERFRGTAGYFNFKNTLVEENKNLRSRLQILEGTLLQTDMLVQENEELKFELGRETSSKRILAYVLSGPGASPYDTLLLDAGEREGIQDGDTIFINGGLPIGRIQETYAHSSLVRLYSSPGEEVSVDVPPAHFIAKAYGRGGGSFLMNLPKDIEIRKGDLLSLPGIENGILGIAESVETDPVQSLKRVIFRSTFNVYQIEKVYIETKE